MAEFLIGNIKGPKGETGKGITILDYYDTFEDLSSDITNPSQGDAYCVGVEQPYDIYIYSMNKGWVNNGPLQGAKGDNATISRVTATVDEKEENPSVTVTMGGTVTDRTFEFAFSGLKGKKGDKGDKGDTVDINEQAPTYSEASTLATLTSGEKLSVVFGKIKKAIADLISHLADSTKHITAAERTTWNGVSNEAGFKLIKTVNLNLTATRPEGNGSQGSSNSMTISADGSDYDDIKIVLDGVISGTYNGGSSAANTITLSLGSAEFVKIASTQHGMGDWTTQAFTVGEIYTSQRFTSKSNFVLNPGTTIDIPTTGSVFVSKANAININGFTLTIKNNASTVGTTTVTGTLKIYGKARKN